MHMRRILDNLSPQHCINAIHSRRQRKTEIKWAEPKENAGVAPRRWSLGKPAHAGMHGASVSGDAR